MIMYFVYESSKRPEFKSTVLLLHSVRLGSQLDSQQVDPPLRYRLYVCTLVRKLYAIRL